MSSNKFASGKRDRSQQGHITENLRHVEAAETVTDAIDEFSPVPTNDPEDPLNWPMWLKIVVLTQASLLAAVGGLNTASINPALVKLGHEFGITTVRASYQTTVCIALNGIAPWLWMPLANKYGRRPVYLATTFLGFASALGCAYTKSFTQLIVARVFNGLFPVAFALGASTVVDLFFYHQRGRAMGFFTVTMVNGSHLAPIIGGLLGQYLGWRWIFKFAAIVDGVLFLTTLFCIPETLYIRPAVPMEPNNGHRAQSIPPFTMKMYLNRLRLIHVYPDAPLKPSSFVLPTLKMACYPSVLFPALYYATMYGFASILPAVTVAAIFTEYFHWNTLTIGLTYGASLTIGGCLGEACSGWVLDLILKRAARRLPTGQHPPPEVRLKALIPGEILVPIGLLIYGFTIQYHTHWFLPIFGMALSCFGLQIITTTTYTYSIDCYRPHSAEVAQVFNFIRQEIGMTFAFYVVHLGESIGYQWTFLFFAICGGVLAFLPILGLMLKGQAWRGKWDARMATRKGAG